MYQTDGLHYCILMIKKELLVNWHTLVMARPVHLYYYDRLLYCIVLLVLIIYHYTRIVASFVLLN
jgi:hypothetical protein